jgi:hypothetical protein
VQAAERHVRETAGLTAVGDLSLESVSRFGEAWDVSFAAAGKTRAVRVESELGDLTLLTCGDATPKRPRRYVISPG